LLVNGYEMHLDYQVLTVQKVKLQEVVIIALFAHEEKSSLPDKIRHFCAALTKFFLSLGWMSYLISKCPLVWIRYAPVLSSWPVDPRMKWKADVRAHVTRIRSPKKILLPGGEWDPDRVGSAGGMIR